MGKTIPWTDEEINILEEGYKNGISVNDIAMQLGKSAESVRSMAYKKEFTKKYPKQKTSGKVDWTDEEVRILEDCYKNYMPIKEVANILTNHTEKAISAKANKLGFSKLYVKKNSTSFKAEYQDYDWLYQRIITEGKQPKDIAKETGYTRRVIEKWADYYRLNEITFKEHASLTPLQRSLIIGGVLGDGHICLLNNSAVYIESHAINQKDYLFWKYNILKNLCASEPTYYASSYHQFGDKEYLCQPSYRFQTRLVNELIDIKKLTRFELIDRLDELGLSAHFLDDAYLGTAQWQMCFGDWTKEEKDYYIKCIDKKFGIKLRLDNYDNRYACTINKPITLKLNDIILRNIPNDLDIIQYKIIKKVV